MTTVLSIGTTHPWNVAGVGLDLRVGTELGVRVLTVVMAVSAQDARGLHALETLPLPIVRAQYDALPLAEVHAVRIGALSSPEHVREVAAMLRELCDVPAVVDPVLRATRGGTFADAATVDAIRHELAGLPNVILTPNVPEAEALLGGRIVERGAAGDAAGTLQRLGSRAVLVTGGHLEGDPVDALATRDGVELFSGARLPHDMRGSGCVLAMALAVELGGGSDLRAGVQHARAFVRAKIESARQFGDLRVAY